MATRRRTPARRKPAQRKSRSKYIARRKSGMLSGVGEGYSDTFKLIVLAVLTVGIYFLWKKWKEAEEAKKAAASTTPGTTPAQLPPAQKPAQLPASTTAPKEVANAFFQSHPFAYAATSGSSLNVRSSPSDTAQQLASIANNGYIGRHTGFSVDTKPGDSSTRWAKVTLQDGRTGWVFSKWIKSEAKQRVSSIASKPNNSASIPRPSSPSIVAKPITPKTAPKPTLKGADAPIYIY